MTATRRALTGAAVLATALTLSGCGYNQFQSLDEQTKSAWSEVLNQYQRRADLIPNIVATVKGEANFEQETLTKVIEARSKATSIQATPELINNPEAFNKFQQAQGELSSALSRLMVVVEQYPNLQANQNFLALQEELVSTENKIGFARQHYNDCVMDLNNAIESFPSNVIAGMFSFKQEPFFEIADKTERAVPKVTF